MQRLRRTNSEGAERPIPRAHVGDLKSDASVPGSDGLPDAPRIALVTPYTGGNLGDAAIQDAVVANIGRRLPGVQFSGITLNCQNFLDQHGTGAFPLVGAGIPFFQMETAWASGTEDLNPRGVRFRRIRKVLRHIPGARAAKGYLKKTRSRFGVIRSEVHHWAEGYRFLRAHDLLLFSGGGQLDDNYGGPRGLPLTLLKWVLLARFARVPCAMASVGVGTIKSPVSRRLISVALRLCSYRSFREARSRVAASTMFQGAIDDSVVPDFALSLSDSELPPPVGSIRAMAGGRPVVAVSPMAFAKPVNWPAPDRALHDRYLQQMAAVLSMLCQQDYFVVVACSSRGDDESVIPDILERLDKELREGPPEKIYLPKINTWKELVSVLQNADYLIASRLHGTVFGFLTETPVVAISFAPKADWIIEYLYQSDYRLDIRDFTAEDVLKVLKRIERDKDSVVERIASHRKEILLDSGCAQQYSLLAKLALTHHQSRN